MFGTGGKDVVETSEAAVAPSRRLSQSAKRAAIALTACAFATQAFAAGQEHWGSFRYEGCVTPKVCTAVKDQHGQIGFIQDPSADRPLPPGTTCVAYATEPSVEQYSAVLWGVPRGVSWEDACARMPATIKFPKWPTALHFNQPTSCVTATTLQSADLVASAAHAAEFLTMGLGAEGAEAFFGAVGGAAEGTAFVTERIKGHGGLNEWGIFSVAVPAWAPDCR
jgi:hypothetical protein